MRILPGAALPPLLSLVIVSPAPAHGAVPELVRLTEHAWAWVANDDRSSNGAFFVGDDAVLAVDPGLTPAMRRPFFERVRSVTDRPVRWTVLTHWHPDHAFGAVTQADRDYELIAHPKTRRAWAERGASLRGQLAAAAPSPEEREEIASSRIHLPDRILAERDTFDLGGFPVQVFPAGPAHTPGDLVVWAPDDGVLVTGDLVMSESCPSMGEGSTAHWLDALSELTALDPVHVVPGHFAVGGPELLRRFRGYLQAQTRHARDAVDAGRSDDEAAGGAHFPEFDGFAQYPQYGATFADNARTVTAELRRRPARPGETNGFSVRAVIRAGEAPHQITFSPDGLRAYVAAAGSDRITVVDTESLEIADSLAAPGTPLGVAVLPDGAGLAVTAFRADHILELPGDGHAGRRLVAGEGSSLFTGPLPGDLYLVPTETMDKLHVFDAGAFTIAAEYPTGARPFPAAATSDGRKAFVPNYDDGTLTVVDLWNGRVVDTVYVGVKPSGATTMPGDVEVAVAVRGENRIVWVNTASHAVTGSLSAGIGESPFSIALSPDGSLAYVNNTGSDDISVIVLPERRVTARVPVGRIPIVLATHPVTGDLWVGCEGSDDLYVVRPPETDAPGSAGANDVPAAPTTVAVMGMIHGGHEESETWGLAQVEAAIRAYDPDVILAEIPPDRWDRVWTDWAERGVIEDPRVERFPEYTKVLLPLKVELGFEVEPCAAWTREMADLRAERMRQFAEEPRFTERHAEFERRNAEIEKRHAADPIAEDDPFVIHSDLYDTRVREELDPYDELLNDWIGPGGWTNINAAHFALIEDALARHRGERVLITFGSGHKYWFLEKLRGRADVELADLKPFLR